MIPGPGPCGPIPLMEDFRFSELKVRGIDFSQSFNIGRMELDFSLKDGRVPLFKDGILYALPYSKGEVLQSFLEKTKYQPKRVWFVDNDQRQVDNVAVNMSRYGIPYVGIKYLDQLLIDEKIDKELGEFHILKRQEYGSPLTNEKMRSPIE